METVPDTGLVQRKTMGDALHIPPGEREREGRDSGETAERNEERQRYTRSQKPDRFIFNVKPISTET